MLDKKLIIPIAIAAVLILILGAFIFGRKPGPSEEAELEFWGVFDDSDVYGPLLAGFSAAFPEIKVSYYKKDVATYEKTLLEAMASGRGPDVFLIHNSWIARYLDKIYGAPAEIVTLKQVQDSFVDAVYDDFVVENVIAGLPLSVDTMALYYNKDIFNTEAIAQPPATWDDFLDAVEKVTQKDERGNILRAGATLGTARNINRSTDILALLMLQAGTPIVDETNKTAVFGQAIETAGETFKPGVNALQFYTDFANPVKSVHTWNTRMDYSIDSFAKGQSAMMLSYAYNLPVVRAKAPYLNFAVAAMPQISATGTDVNYANYWGLVVSKNAASPQAGWRFVNWLTGKESAQQYLTKTKRPAARRDLVAWQKNDPEVGVFSQQALSAVSWWQVDNSALEQQFADMIESVVLGEQTVEQAVSRAAERVSALMRE